MNSKFFRLEDGDKKADVEFDPESIPSNNEGLALPGPSGHPPDQDNPYITLSYLQSILLGLEMSTGMIVMFGGSSAPSGWLLCDGSAVSRVAYNALFAIIGTAFGSGDGSTTFNLPDLRQRFPLGKAASGTGQNIGDVGGAIDHDHSIAAHNHSIAAHNHSIAAHQHGITGPSGAPSATTEVQSGTGSTVGSDTHTHSLPANTDNDAGTNTGDSGSGNTGDGGSGSTGSTNPPFQAVNFIIKT